MLKVYICPKCQAVRYVSKFKTQCFKCNLDMVLSNITYENFIELDSEQRSRLTAQAISN